MDNLSQFMKLFQNSYNCGFTQGWVYENGPAGIYSDAAGCGTVFENNVLKKRSLS